ncbi:RDD family protein [Lysobacter claricitrinus]|uniref:RDD family protein n=1 Tax=Lysobacter claricitrinus TaxID=3367728 RepID=UPI0037DBDB2A
MTNHAQGHTPTHPAASIAAGYDASIVVRRWLGAWIDFIVLVSFLLIPDYVLGNARYQATIVVWLGLLVAYFPAMEAVFGKTVGKFLTFTRVVNAEGGRPSLGQAVVRTLFRLIEVNPVLAGGIPAGIAVIASRHKQRLGDMVAGTYVLFDRDLRGRAPAATTDVARAEPPPLPGVS